MKSFKRILAVAILVISLTAVLCCCGSVFSGNDKLVATSEFYVNDFADVIDDDDESYIFNSGRTLDKKTTAQVVVVTVESTDGEEISEFALNLGREWGIGDKEKNNGVLVLLAAQDREVWVSVGYGLEGALPDSKTGRLIDNYAINYFAEDDFSSGLKNLYRAIINEVYIEYGMEAEEGYVPADQLPDGEDESMSTASLIAIIVFIVLVIVLRRFLPMIFFYGGRGPRPPFGGGGFSGGGFSGGGGGFSGGGGSFGGGGAGRKF